LPFQPENILKSDSQKEIMEQALQIEEELHSKFYSQAKLRADEFETFKEEYYKDLVE
jgi:hypothetical protein